MYQLSAKNQRYTIFSLTYFILLSTHYLLNSNIFDDSFIHFRIVENFFNYGVPYYNPDTAVMSSSSPAWTVFLYAIFWPVGKVDIDVLSVINASLTFLSVFLGIRIVERFVGRSIESFSLTISIALLLGIMITPSIQLMETPLAIVFLLGGIYMLQNRVPAGFILLAVATSVRPELILTVIAALFLTCKSRNDYARAIVYAAIGGLPFVVYDFYYFGTVIPHALKAKSIVYQWNMGDSADGLIQSMPLIGRSLNYLFKLVVLIAVLRILFVSIRNLRAKNPTVLHDPMWALIGGGIGLASVYILTRTYMFSWYAPLVGIPVVIGLLGIMWRFGITNNLKRIMAFASVPYFFSIAIVLFAATVDETKFPDFNGSARVLKYIEVSERLYKKFPKYSLMTAEIGGIGYGFKGKIYDGVGLIDSGPLKYHPLKVPEERSFKSAGAIPAKYVEEMNPEIIVAYKITIEQFMRSPLTKKYNVYEEPPFRRKERLKMVNYNTGWGESPLYVYIRKDIDTGWEVGR